jgi:hypothetical protein|tara:strand:+ start:461 stop:1189 length:729 start_codon:yes stop_codon:yes gene_type:complete
MKLAIYGDSYGANSDEGTWPRLLHNSLGVSQFDNYCLDGSSTEYSYLRFLETYNSYDMIIFIWTSPNRSSVVTDDNGIFKHHAIIHPTFDIKDIINFHNEYLKKYPKYFSPMESRLLNHIKHESIMAKSVYNNRHSIYFKAMRDSVKYHFPNVINLEAFGNASIYRITHADAYLQGITGYLFEEDTSVRKNHLTYKQNSEVANYLFQHIKDKKIDIAETFKDPLKYYTMSKNIKESGFLKRG